MIKRGILLTLILINIAIIALNSNAQLFFTGVVLNPKIVTVNEKINLTIDADKSFKFFEKAFLCGATGKTEIPLNGKRFSRAVIENNICIRNCQQEQWFEGSVNATFSFPQDTLDGTYAVNVYGCRILTEKWNCTWASGIVQYASDVTPPKIISITPENNAVITDRRNLVLSVTFEDLSIDPEKVSFVLTGKETVQEESIKATSITITTASATLTETLLKGHYSLTAIVVDKSGNRATKTIVFDVGLPNETPLIIKDLISATSTTERSVWSIKTFVDNVQEVEIGRLTNNVFTDKAVGEGPVLIESLFSPWTAQQIQLTSERGTFNAFLPAGSEVPCGQGLVGKVKYYIAIDGTSYFADSLNNGCGTFLQPEQAITQQHLARRPQ
ncbi:hypothetical protein HY498_00330 [Candidatus Woesearchaeota archaeon]|nr:hypothetical protein [Candidatus Woesearchaeota archaeon]